MLGHSLKPALRLSENNFSERVCRLPMTLSRGKNLKIRVQDVFLKVYNHSHRPAISLTRVAVEKRDVKGLLKELLKESNTTYSVRSNNYGFRTSTVLRMHKERIGSLCGASNADQYRERRLCRI